MTSSVCRKLELDVMQANEIDESALYASKYNIPAMVVHQDLLTGAIIARGKRRGRYKIIVPIDWPRGDTYGFNKFRGLTSEAMSTDGFEILLTPNKNLQDTRNEAKLLSSFIRDKLSKTAEIRFVLGSQLCDDEQLKIKCQALLDIAMPSLVRTDTHLKVQVNKANPETHNRIMTLVRDIMRVPLKISGNVASLRAIAECQTAAKFAVSLTQLKSIIKEALSQPDELRSLLK